MASTLPAERLNGEWLEADGLGGFASGTVGGVRSRRYHALLLAATTPPTGRVVLVNGIEVELVTAAGRFALSAQRYTPDVTHPDGQARLVDFQGEPWPRWTFRAEDGATVTQEIVARHGHPEVALRWRLDGPSAGARLIVRPLLSGRDYHGLHHENVAFAFEPEIEGARVTFRPYPGLPAITVLCNGAYRHEPAWYRSFQYDAERERGLDFVEDLAAPGGFELPLDGADAVMVFCAGEAEPMAAADPGRHVRRVLAAERARRAGFASPLHRAADQYVVRRDGGRTIVAGYPWFTDWGRDTFITLRGFMGLPGGLELARDILSAWAPTVSEGMVPNRFPDGGEVLEYNAVDAALWYVVAVHEFLQQADAACVALPASVERPLHAAVDAIIDGYGGCTRYGIHVDDDGLIVAGVPGVQLTWMDAKVGDQVITPRIGKPVEIQALWLNALRIASAWRPGLQALYECALAAFRTRFWNAERGCLYDVVDVDHVPGRDDPALRPNQIFAVGGLPYPVLDNGRARQVVDIVERELLTPLGLRSLAPGEPGYRPRYGGGVWERDSAYHQGTVWPWLIGPFVEAWLRVRGSTPEARREADARFITPLRAHLGVAGIGHISEVADGEAPHRPGGCPFQAWSLGELLRASRLIGADQQDLPSVHARKRA